MNTVLLAAGKPDFKNMVTGLTSSQLMGIVKGKPIISWVINDYLKCTSLNLTIVVNESDKELVDFLNSIYLNNHRISICIIDKSDCIVESCLKGINKIIDIEPQKVNMPLRIILGDTLLKNTKYISGNYIYVTEINDFSEKWCLAAINNKNIIEKFYNKVSGLNTKDYKVLVGRYEFKSTIDFKNALEEILQENKTELSDAIENYQTRTKEFIYPITVSNRDWIDFGHLEGIAKAKSNLMESRSFNCIKISTPIPCLIKRSSNKEKLEKEVFWYKNIPNCMKTLAPRLISYNSFSDYSEIKMEYYGYSTLSEKFVYSNLSLSFWNTIINNLFIILNSFYEIKDKIEINEKAYNIYFNKTLLRLDQLNKQRRIWSKIFNSKYLIVNNKEYLNINELICYIKEKSKLLSNNVTSTLIHGDFCFNNILYDIQSGIVKLIDPRGEFGDGLSIYGDIRYDIAKLRHSFCGGYDHLIEGNFNLIYQNNKFIDFNIVNFNKIDNEILFDSIVYNNGFNINEIKFIEALLFISMIPLHSDSFKKQVAFYLQGIMKMNKCFNEWK